VSLLLSILPIYFSLAAEKKRLKLIVPKTILVPTIKTLQIEQLEGEGFSQLGAMRIIYNPKFANKAFTEKVKAIIKVTAERHSAGPAQASDMQETPSVEDLLQPKIPISPQEFNERPILADLVTEFRGFLDDKLQSLKRDATESGTGRTVDVLLASGMVYELGLCQRRVLLRI
jgi:hypothetical protein